MFRAVALVLILDACSYASTYSDIELGASQLVVTPTHALADGVIKAQVVVQARDAAGRPIAGLQAVLVAPGCDIEQPSALTNSAGIAVGFVRSVQPGTRPITAVLRRGDLTYGLQAKAAVQWQGVSVAGQGTAGGNFALQIVAVAPEGTVDGQFRDTVQFTSSDPLAELPSPYTFTAADAGSVIFPNVVLHTAGVQTVTATDITAHKILLQKTFVVQPGPATRLVATLGTANPVVGTETTLQVTAYDNYNNIATGYTGTLQLFCSRSGAAIPTTYQFTPSDAGSHVLSRFLFSQPGVTELIISDPTQGTLRATLSFTVFGGAATHLQFILSDPNTTAGQTMLVTALASDAFGNTDVNYNDDVLISSTDSQATLPQYVTLSAGQGTFAATLLTAGTQSIDAVDAAQGRVAGHVDVTVVPASMMRFAVAGPASITAGDYANLLLTAVDAYNNAVATYRGTAIIQSSDPQAIVLARHNFSSTDAGQLALQAILTTAGNQTITVFDSTQTQLAGAVSVLVLPAQVARLRWEGLPNPWTAGVSAQAVLQAVDAYGNVVTSYQNSSVQLVCSDPNAVFPTQVAFDAPAQGQVLINTLSLRTAGVQSLTATDSQGLQGQATGIVVTPAAVAAVQFKTSPQANQTACASLTPGIEVTSVDAFGNRVAVGGAVRLALLGAPLGTQLSGTLRQPFDPNASAVFTDLQVDRAATGLRLMAQAEDPNLATAQSSVFQVTEVAPVVLSASAPAGASACVPITYAVQSACPVTLTMQIDPNGSGNFVAASQSPTGSLGITALGAQHTQSGGSAAPLTFMWDASRDAPHRVLTQARLKITARTLQQTSNALTVSLPTINNGASWQAPLPLALGALAGDAAWADLNADGLADWIVTLPSNNAVAVLLANPNMSGQFAAATQFTAGHGPTAMMCVDMNHDGHTDCVVLNPNDSAVSVLWGNGAGSFTGPASVSVGSDGVAVATGDINRDGLLDIVVNRGNSSNALTWSLQTAGGGFAAAQSVAAGGAGAGLALADINQDGTLDAVLAQGTANVSVFLGTGNGFGSPTAVPVNGVGQRVFAVDINHDAYPDVISAGASGVSVLLNGGSGSLTLSQSLATTGQSDVAVADFDGDGTIDVLTATPTALSLYLNQGHGILSASPQTFATAWTLARLTVASLNRDKAPDIIAWGADSNLWLLANARPPACTWGLDAPNGTFLPFWETAGAVGDFNEDGKPDVLVTSQTAGTSLVLAGDGAGGLNVVSGASTGFGAQRPAVADVDGDGHVDGITVNANDNSITALWGNGSGTFATSSTIDLSALGTVPAAIRLGDLDGDGRIDVVIGNQTGIATLTNAGFRQFKAQSIAAVGAVVDFDVGDINQDGFLDAVAAGASSTVWVLLGQGTGGLTVTSTLNSACAGAKAASLSDITGDGKLDLVVACSGVVDVLVGDGQGGFAAPIATSGLDTNGLVVADFNNDTLPDVATFGNGALTVAIGDGTGHFASSQYGAQLGGQGGLAADLNSDGAVDVISLYSTTVTGDISNWMLTSTNDGQGHFSAAASASALGAGGDFSIDDFNHDGFADVVQVAASNQVAIFINDASGNLGIKSTITPASAPPTVLSADINNDTWPDLIIGMYSVNIMSPPHFDAYLNGQSAPYFFNVTASGSMSTLATSIAQMAADDVNHDGTVDLLVCAYGDHVTRFLGTGGGNFSSGLALGSTITPGAFAAADLQRNGNKDIIEYTFSGVLCIKTTDPNGNPDTINGSHCAYSIASPCCGRIATGDINGDGIADFACMSGAATFQVFFGDGTAQFGPAINYVLPGNPTNLTSCPAQNAPWLADMNGDGFVDFVAPSGTSMIYVFLNRGDGTFGQPLYFLAAGIPQKIKTADFNADGLIDLVTSDSAAGESAGGIMVRYGK